MSERKTHWLVVRHLFTSVDFIIIFISILLLSFHIFLSRGTCAATLGTVGRIPGYSRTKLSLFVAVYFIFF